MGYNEEEIIEGIDKLEKTLERKIKKTEEDSKEEIERLIKIWETTFTKKTEELEEMDNLKKSIKENGKIFQEMNIHNEPKQQKIKQISLQEELNRQQRQITEVNKPIFYGNDKDQHPKDFISELEEYFRIRQRFDDKKLIIVRSCLKTIAYNWYMAFFFKLRV